jgi:hypothetical protein
MIGSEIQKFEINVKEFSSFIIYFIFINLLINHFFYVYFLNQFFSIHKMDNFNYNNFHFSFVYDTFYYNLFNCFSINNCHQNLKIFNLY